LRYLERSDTVKRLGDTLTAEKAGSEILMGNHALVRAMVESGVRVVTSYPGSPTPETADAIRSISADKRPFYFEFSVNEKVATEVAFGASVNGFFSTVFFKSVGLNVAADSFVQLSMMELTGGMVIVLGDDPGANSSQNEQDNRHYARLAYTPVFEPSSPQEIYDMYREAAAISKEKRMPVILRLTTHTCHAKEKIHFNDWKKPESYDNTPRFDPANGPYIPITSAVFPLKRKALERLREMERYSESSPFNRLEDNGSSDRGVITAGVPYLSLLEVLEGRERKPDILRLGIVHPLPRGRIAEFLKKHREVKILEELDDFLEKEIKSIAFDEAIPVRIIGKTDLEDWVGEYTPDKVAEVLRKSWSDLFPAAEVQIAPLRKPPQRPPQLCPGCGHRSAFYAIKKALGKTAITVADIGCHTLGFLQPYSLGQVLLCMGHSSGTAAGLSLLNRERPVVAFLGDSTFFHAGLPGIVNALFNSHNFTLVIMENGTTAMTGHQDHPASGRNFSDPVDRIPVKQVLQGLGVKKIWETDTYGQKRLTDMMKEALSADGFKVVIARHPCMLKFTREQRKKGSFRPNPAFVKQDVCTKAHECVEVFACPSFQREPDGAVWVTNDLCIGDGSCIATCPSAALQLGQRKKEGGDEEKA
jgi:indolepyruvate ferredoxin oxidoreductase alpha subunit